MDTHESSFMPSKGIHVKFSDPRQFYKESIISHQSPYPSLSRPVFLQVWSPR